MYDVNSVRGNMPHFFRDFLAYAVSIFSGYPNRAIKKPANRLTGFIKPYLIQLLCSEGFNDEHILLQLGNRLVLDLDNFYAIDDVTGYWLLEKTGTASSDLFVRCRKEIQCGILDNMIEKGATFPNWLEDQVYQEYLEKAIQIVEQTLRDIEIFEDQLLAFRKVDDEEGPLLSYEWEMRQNIKYLRWIMQKGIRQAFPEIIQNKREEQNPLGWITVRRSQRIKDKIDKANSFFDHKKAVKLLKSALQLKPQPIEACNLYYNIAMQYEELENWEEAIEAYTQMLTVVPPNAVGLLYRAKIYHHLGRDIEARKDLEEALSLPPLHLYVFDNEMKREAQSFLCDLSALGG